MVSVLVRLPNPLGGDSHDQETILAPSTDKKTLTYDTECSNHNPSLSYLRSKGLSPSKMKWLAIYTNLQVSVEVRIPNLRGGESQGQETFSAPSPDKRNLNCDTECSNHHPYLSTPRSKGLRPRKIKW